MTELNEQNSLKSAELYERAKKVMPGGCSRNTIIKKPHPLYAKHAKGCRITDIDGIERLDFANNMASHIHGHAHPEIVEAVSRQLSMGTAFTLGTEVEIAFAEHMCNRSENFEKIRFVNSGTEAIMCAIKAARAYTGKPKIAKVEGAYHGLYDYAEVSQTSKPENWGDYQAPAKNPVSYGTPQSTLDDVVIIPFNDIETAISILDRHSDEIACVVLDLMPHRVGFIGAEPAFAEAIYKWSKHNNALLVIDEVVTFRTEYGGLQERYDIRPDLTAMGKMIGGGFPVGALAGRADVMDVMNPLKDKLLFPHSGTFSANPITMTAGYTAMQLYDQTAVVDLNKLGHYTRKSLSNMIESLSFPASVTGFGSVFKIHLQAQMPRTYREAFKNEQQTKLTNLFLNAMWDQGIILISTGAGVLSTAMTPADIDQLTEAVSNSFKSLLPYLEAP